MEQHRHHGGHGARTGLGTLGVVAILTALVVPPTLAQDPPAAPGATATTAPGATPGQPSGSDLAEGAAQAPAGAPDAGGDGPGAPAGGVVVPPEAQRIIRSVRRTGPTNNGALLTQLAELTALGLSEEEAFRVGLGRFPIAGAANYSHDWLYPRYGPGFRFHLGTDVFAARGTPVRAPVDGVARSANGGLGGLTIKVVMSDGTYFYLAHLAGLVEGFVENMAVETGDIVGYVGDSGNARGGSPHLHIGIYPHGGPPIDPKPVLDRFLEEASARLPQVVAAYRAALPPAAAPGQPTEAQQRRALRPMLATEVLHPLTARGSAVSARELYRAGVDPARGPEALIERALGDLVASIAWGARAASR